LYGSGYSCRKRPCADLVTGRAAYLLYPMLAHHQVNGRQVMHLLVFLDFPWKTLKRRLSVLTSKRAMAHHLVWRGAGEQGVSEMPHLPA
jgi:hypothetical protein